MGMDFVIASPPGYQPKGEIVAEASQLASQCGAHLAYLFEPEAAVEKADIVYTDVWVSMGQEVEMEKRRRDLAHYQVNQELLSLAKADALVMHPLPAHHGEEIAEGLLESTRSIVFDQAENRLHIQKAILIELLK
jgi:ornithine carbamoyltransferase